MLNVLDVILRDSNLPHQFWSGKILQEKPELAGIISDILSRRQVVLGQEAAASAVPTAVQKNQLLARIGAFFGIGGIKAKA